MAIDECLDVVASDFWEHKRLVIPDDVTFFIDEELCPAELNLLRQPVTLVVQLAVASQESVDRVSRLAVNFNFGEQRELDILARSEGFDFLVGARLLIVEGVAWESKYLKTFVSELLVEADQICI